MIKSPLRYPGGKSKALKKLSEYTQIPFLEYREPFVGGASLFIYLKQINPEKFFWINDLNTDVYSFWKATQSNPKALIQRIKDYKKAENGKELYFSLIQANTDELDLIERAARFFVLNRISFSGTTESGGYSERAFRERFTESAIKRVALVSDLLDKKTVKITNLDYSELLKSDTKTEADSILIYLDPPYFSATNSKLYGKRGNLHLRFDHDKFAEDVKNCSSKWFISYDNSEFIRERFSFAKQDSWQLQYGMNNPHQDSCKMGEELIISNFSECKI